MISATVLAREDDVKQIPAVGGRHRHTGVWSGKGIKMSIVRISSEGAGC